MFSSYVKIAFRNLAKHKLYSLINIGGMAIGLACAILMLLWVRDEAGFDRFHVNADAVYRVNWDFKANGSEGVGPGTPPPLSAALVKEVPGVKSTTRIYVVPNIIVRKGDKIFSENRIFAVNSNFFDLFTNRVASQTVLDAVGNGHL